VSDKSEPKKEHEKESEGDDAHGHPKLCDSYGPARIFYGPINR